MHHSLFSHLWGGLLFLFHFIFFIFLSRREKEIQGLLPPPVNCSSSSLLPLCNSFISSFPHTHPTSPYIFIHMHMKCFLETHTHLDHLCLKIPSSPKHSPWIYFFFASLKNHEEIKMKPCFQLVHPYYISLFLVCNRLLFLNQSFLISLPNPIQLIQLGMFF